MFWLLALVYNYGLGDDDIAYFALSDLSLV